MQDKANVRILPPVVLVAALGLGILIATIVPAKILPAGPAIAIGLFVVGSSIFLLFSAVLEMTRAKTAFDVRKPTSAIVTTGVFRFSRNPVYLSMMLLYVGTAFLVNSPWMLVLAIPLGSVLCVAAIKPEERYLEAKFGDVYCRYRTRVRRWI